MKLNKVNILAVLPLLISSVFAHGAEEVVETHHSMMGSSWVWGMGMFFFMALFTVLVIMAILWLAKEVRKK